MTTTPYHYQTDEEKNKNKKQCRNGFSISAGT
jgi:hypothetical protein